jgi:hypothetical protein
VAVLQFAGLDPLLEDVDTLLTAGQVPQYMTVVQGFLAGLNQLEGLDRQRPFGGMLFIDPADPQREPQPLIYLPVSDVVALRATIVGTGNSLEPTADPTVLALRLGQDELQMIVDGGYGFITDPRKSPPAFRTERLLHVLKTAHTAFDVALSVRRAGIPPTVIEQAIAQVRQDAATQMEQRPGEDEAGYGLRVAIESSLFELVGLALTEGQELSVGVLLVRDAPLVIDAEFRTEEEGELREWLAGRLIPPAFLPTGDAAAPALAWRGAVQLSGAGRDIGRRLVAMAHAQIHRELGSQAPPEVLRQVDSVMAALDATLTRGELESRIEFLPTKSGRFVLLAGAAVENAGALDEAARALLPLAAQAGDLQRADIDAMSVDGIAFHRIEGKEVRERDRRLYGPDLSLYFGARDGAAWMAVGGEETSGVLSQALLPPADAVQPVDAASLTVRVRPWIDFALREGVARNRQFAEIAASLLADDATIHAGLRSTERGVRLTVEVDPDYVDILARYAVWRVKGQAP